jgi:hypothetical protein
MAAASNLDGAADAGSESGGSSENEKVMFHLTVFFEVQVTVHRDKFL